MTKVKKSNAGRKSIIDELTLKKLEEGFSMGLTDTEASLYANISSRTLYNYQEKFPEFVQRKEQLKDNTKMHAKVNVHKAIKKGDEFNSRWYLEKKDDSFNPKSKVDQDTTVRIKAINYSVPTS